MIPEYVLKIILLDNPWLEGGDPVNWYSGFLPDYYIPRCLTLAASHKICLVVGPRQAGKSTLIWKTLSEAGEPCLYINCEEPAIREWLLSPAEFIADLNTLISQGTSVFFDEIQQLHEAGLFLKGVVDRRTDHSFYATGSSAFDLEAATRESLAGRADRHLLLPLSLEEISREIRGAPALVAREKSLLFEKLLIYGGYPPVYTAKQPERELIGLVEAFVIRDASDRFRIKQPAAFRKIMELSASQIGSLCNYSEWANVAGISSDTVKEYAGMLEDSHILRFVRPFVGGKRAEITSTPKIYFLDNGIRNQLFGGFQNFASRTDRGALLENFIFSELYKSINPLLDSVKYWRSKSGAGVDFIVEKKGEITAWEVKAGDCRGKITRSSRSFIDAYQPSDFYVVNQGRYPKMRIGGTTIHFLPPEEVGTVLTAREKAGTDPG